ncbi:hypothetical protein N1851_014082 [Merluccius polli]|uniref:Uncharacterized protein n=1 Tax=Merluccius polli TaxID=89951 RepID=A0AA47MTY0_MERPO|nr:hypothetical protein N1851_014082 [Merluccius polli]
MNHSSPNLASTDNTISDLARFLAKSQLVTEGLTKFDDKPENYLSWKATFQSTVADLGLTASEKARTCKKKGQSSQHTSSIFWSEYNLEKTMNKAIESALFSRIENSTKLSSKTPQKLCKLSDLLLELKAEKLDGGVGPNVEKLPFHLQEKWTTVR